MIIKRTKRFLKAFKKCPKEIQIKIIQKIDQFLDNPHNPQLNIHKLHGQLSGIKALNITGDWRIWFMEEDKNDILVISLLHVGTQTKLY